MSVVRFILQKLITVERRKKRLGTPVLGKAGQVHPKHVHSVANTSISLEARSV
jgi:hypothetical protein